MNSSISHILVLVVLALQCQISSAQNILDACFSGGNPGNDFSGGDNLTNVGGDLGVYTADGWQGANLGVSKPYACDSPRAIRLNSESDPSDVIGLRLSGDLNQGTIFSMSFKAIKTSGNFSLGVYSRSFGQFYEDDLIGAEYITAQNANFNGWTEVTINFNVPATSNGHTWIFLRAENGEGVVANFCQLDLTLPTIDLGPDQEICDGVTVNLDASFDGSWYAWNNGANDSSINAGQEGNYEVQVFNNCGTGTDDFFLTVHEEPELNVINDTTVCEGTTVVLEAPGWNASHVWLDGSTNPTFTVDSAGTYAVAIQDDCFNTTDEITITYLAPPDVDLGPDTTVCGGTVNYNVVSGGATSNYIWNTGSESPSFSVTETGTYSVNITNDCGSVSDQVYVEYSFSPGDFLPDSMVFCEGKEMIIDLTGIEGSFEWSDGSTDAFYHVPNPGWHYVQITDDDSCFVVQDTIVVERVFCDCPVFLPSAFTPNGDGFNEEFNIVYECDPYDYELKIFDRWGQVIWSTNNPNTSWDGRNSKGKLLPTSQFHYLLSYAAQFQGIPIRKQGTVTLIRD